MMNRWFNSKIIATIPVFISANIVAITIWLLNMPQKMMPLALLGVIAAGLVDLDNKLLGRIKNSIYTLIAFSISSFSIQLMISEGINFTFLMMSITFIFIMLGSLGQRYSIISFGTLIIAIYTTLSYNPTSIWYINPILILTGALIYCLCSLIIHIVLPNRTMQESIAKSFTVLAEYLEKKSLFFDPDDIAELENKRISLALKNGNLIDAFNQCRVILFNRLNGQNHNIKVAKMIKYYFVAQEIHERISSTHVSHSKLLEELKNTDVIFRVLRLLEIEAQACRDIAHSLHNNQRYHYDERLDHAINGLNHSVQLFIESNPINKNQQITIKTLIDNLQFVAWQLKHIDQTQIEQDDKYKTAQIHMDQIKGIKNMFLTICSHFTFESQLFRHAVRLSIVVFICCMIVETMHLKLGYWILLTAIFVCQPNYSSTKVRLKQRIIGTVLGILTASIIPFLHPILELQLGLIVITSSLFFFFKSNNYSYSTFFITLQVLIGFNLMGFDITSVTFSRLSDTFVGSFIAWFAVSYLWPDWKYFTIKKVSYKAMQANAKYLNYIIGQLQFGKGDPLKYRIVRRKAHESAAALSTTVANMKNEPKKYQNYLQDSFELLKLNYLLLSYISALGAYRKNMQDITQDIKFLSEFYPICKHLINIIEKLDELKRNDFDGKMLSIEYALEQFNAENDEKHNPVLNIPIQQINLIYQIIPELYESYHKTKNKKLN